MSNASPFQISNVSQESTLDAVFSYSDVEETSASGVTEDLGYWDCNGDAMTADAGFVAAAALADVLSRACNMAGYRGQQ